MQEQQTSQPRDQTRADPAWQDVLTMTANMTDRRRQSPDRLMNMAQPLKARTVHDTKCSEEETEEDAMRNDV